jgi:hypothetical protein
MKNFEHLVLLIGTNPLPNFVVAEYFIEKNVNLKKIWMIYSEKIRSQEGTRELAYNIASLMKKKHPGLVDTYFEFVSLSDVGNAKRISYDITEKLLKRISCSATLHLNYTGGTKVMGVHVYRIIDTTDVKRISERSFSYLDTRTFRIVDDSGIYLSDDLRKEISISPSELIALHGFKRNNEDNPFEFQDALHELKNAIISDRIGEYYNLQNGYRRELYLSDNSKDNKLARSLKQIKMELKESHIDTGIFLNVVQALPAGYRIFNEMGKFNEPESNGKCKDVFEFLDGTWLEYYVFETLKGSYAKTGIAITMDWKIKKDEWIDDFQIDVLLLNGYQFIGISCTTSNKKHICKGKGFEILHRSRQIGGDESRSVIVTCLSETDRDKLQSELRNETGSSTQNILVLGKDDWPPDRLLGKINNLLGIA